MRLNDVQFGAGHTYYCDAYKANCYAVNCHHDDGATLIIELYDPDGDISGELRQIDACMLTTAKE